MQFLLRYIFQNSPQTELIVQFQVGLVVSIRRLRDGGENLEALLGQGQSVATI